MLPTVVQLSEVAMPSMDQRRGVCVVAAELLETAPQERRNLEI